MPTSREAAMDSKSSQRQGFAAMSPERRREIAAKGGREVQRRGTGHAWSGPEAREIARGVAARRRALREGSKSVAAERIAEAVAHGE
jgi:uncharacterized protein